VVSEGVPTTDELERGPCKKARIREVNIKITATTVVSFVRKGVAPLLPKMVWLDPPKAAPMLAPLPVCKRTIIIRAKQTIIWIIIVKVAILFY